MKVPLIVKTIALGPPSLKFFFSIERYISELVRQVICTISIPLIETVGFATCYLRCGKLVGLGTHSAQKLLSA